MSRTGGLFGSLSLADVPGLEQIRGKLFKQQASSRRRFQQNDNDDDPATLEMKQRNMLHTQVALGTLAFSSIMTLLVLFVLEVTTFTHVAFYFPLVLAPVAALQRWRIHFFSDFQSALNNVKLRVHDMAVERNRLMIETSKLERQVKRLTGVEERMSELSKREGYNLEQLQAIIQENGALQREMKKLQAADEMQDLIKVILKSDRDGNGFVSDEEMEELLLRMKYFRSGTSSVTEEQLRRALQSSMTRSVDSLLHITASMVMEDPPAQMDGVTV